MQPTEELTPGEDFEEPNTASFSFMVEKNRANIAYKETDIIAESWNVTQMHIHDKDFQRCGIDKIKILNQGCLQRMPLQIDNRLRWDK